MASFPSSSADAEVVLDFGAEAEAQTQSKKFRHPVVVTFHLAFRSLAFIIFLFGGQFSHSSFITPFVFIILFLCCDFWTVKNVSGRLLVGLRWWNYIDDQGKSHWIFEQAKSSGTSGTSGRKYRAHEVRLFWLSLVAFPLLWLLFFFICLFNPRWLMVALLGLGMTGANLYGYLRCKFGAHAKMRDVATKFVGQKLMENVFSGGKGGNDAAAAASPRKNNPGVPTMDGNVLAA